jgi:hypothetical protein
MHLAANRAIGDYDRELRNAHGSVSGAAAWPAAERHKPTPPVHAMRSEGPIQQGVRAL